MFDITKEWAKYCEGQISILKKENKYDHNRHHYYLDKLFSKNLGDAAYDFLFYEFKSNMSDEVRQELTINIQKFFLKCLENQKELDTRIIENIKSLFMSEFFFPLCFTEESVEISIQTMNYLAQNYKDFNSEKDPTLDDYEVNKQERVEVSEVIDKFTAMFNYAMKNIKNNEDIYFLERMLINYMENIFLLKEIDLNDQEKVANEVYLTERIFNHVNFIKPRLGYNYFFKNKKNVFNTFRVDKEKLTLEEVNNFLPIINNKIELSIKNLETFFPRGIKEVLAGLELLVSSKIDYFDKLLIIKENQPSFYKNKKITYSLEENNMVVLKKIQEIFSEFILDFYKFPEDKKVFKNTVYDKTNNFVYDFVVKIRERALLEKIESSDIQREYKIKKKI